ncbi:hypothetical protein [Acinetobacter baumannii]|uniref:hypothetical protein n=1 Tax=Acinetobacter baumannii TaxID=470 RepID=UPI000FA892EF|nr:hypothetical protein [Acinetobacter baumannii]RUT37137.1 hypothetical protein EM030_18565 [Acinetobacter baumannii]
MPFHFLKRTGDRSLVTHVGFSRAPTYSSFRSRSGREAAVSRSRYAFLQRNATIARPIGSTRELKSFDLATSIASTTNPYTAITFAEPGFVANTSFSSPGVAQPYFEINAVQQGSAYFQRIGSKIRMKSILIRALFAAPISVSTTGQTATIEGSVRCLVVYDRQTSGAPPTANQILSVNSSGIYDYSSVFIPNRSRFLVLRDKILKLDTASGLTQIFDEYIKCDLDTEYQSSSTNSTISTAGTVGDITTGAVYFISFYTQGSYTTTVGPTMLSYISRLRYYDA